MSNARKVSTDALETLGSIIDENQKRDAIHLAVLPMIAGQSLKAGQDIGVVDGQAFKDKDCLGIVDPFLKVPVKKGDRFWMVLYPRMVTSLRHVWSHPAFSDEPGSEAKPVESPAMFNAKHIIQGCADAAGLSFDEMIDGAEQYLLHGDYLCEGGRWDGFWLDDAFWPAFEIVTGRTVPEDDRGSFFSCSC